jgi:putative ABC transport system permease protein
MIISYFIIAWRNLWKSKVFSIINILGLSIGLSCCILMFLFIRHELSYDKFNAGAKNIYRITSIPGEGKDKKELAVTPAPWAPLMKKDYPGIKEYVRLLKDEKTVVGQPGEQHFYEKDLLYADSTFFTMFSIGLERGDVKKALERPNSIILTERNARKYFGDADPIGKTLEINSFGRTFNVEVTAIAKEVPANSHFRFNSLISLQTLGDLTGLWSFHMFQSYLLLDDNVSAKEIEKKLRDFNSRFLVNNAQADGKQDIHLQPLTDIHLYSKMTGEIGTNGDITYVYVFAAAAIFILLLACFNFTNLSTARALSRAKEVGLRKVVGAAKSQLLKQFLGETTFFAIIALLVAILIVFLILPVFNQLADRELSLDFSRNYPLMILLLLLMLFVGLIAGLYPAAVLSSFKPVEVLKGKFFKSDKGVSFRKILVTLQFVVSIALIAGTILITKQLRFLQDKKLGFDKENVVVLTLPKSEDSSKLETMKASLAANPGIRAVAASSTLPGVNIAVNLVNDGSADLSKAISMQMLFIDNDFIRTMQMKLVAGRDFSSAHPTDRTEGFILNEEAVKRSGWKSPAEAIGKTFQWVQPNVVLKSGKVTGVVQDFNITPLKAAVQPLVMHIFPQRFQYLYVRFDQSKAGSIIPAIEKSFHEVYAKQSFEYSFLNDTLAAMYRNEKKLGTIFSYFSILAILIACLGVLGLSLYSIQQRIKEIGIRKVLGASVSGITGLLIKEFVRPILIATIIATPVIWYAMNKWLQDFAYRVEISWWIFPLAGIISLLIAFFTISIQAIKAAMANPVTSLRTE